MQKINIDFAASDSVASREHSSNEVQSQNLREARKTHSRSDTTDLNGFISIENEQRLIKASQ